MTRRYNHPKRQHDARALEQRRVMERLNDPASPIIDVTFIKLHEELAQWPDAPEGDVGWESVAPCGYGNNPHAWFVNKTDQRVRRVRMSEATYPEVGEIQLQQIHIETVAKGVEMCVCGVTKEEWEEMESTLFDSRLILHGLITRDVQ